MQRKAPLNLSSKVEEKESFLSARTMASSILPSDPNSFISNSNIRLPVISEKEAEVQVEEYEEEESYSAPIRQINSNRKVRKPDYN